MNDNNQCTSAMNEEDKEYSRDEVQQGDFERFLSQENPLSNVTKKYLAKGGFGIVYTCLSPSLSTLSTFVMKEVLFNPGEEVMKEVIALEREIKLYKSLPKHPRIVQYLGMMKNNEALYIFMEYMEGGSLTKYLAINGKLDLKKIARYTKQILEGLDFLHHRKIIHRDIKGDNILRDLQDNLKLCDFGLCKLLRTISSSNPTPENEEKNETNTYCGTCYWMAPEVIKSENYSFPADIWSLGATVVQMLTGTHPYPKHRSQQALFVIGNTRKLVYEPQKVTPQFQSFLDSMLKPNPQDRAKTKDLLNSEFICPVSETEEMQQ